MSSGPQTHDEVLARAGLLLVQARTASRNGSHDDAWRACQEAAAIGRQLQDARLVAHAATALAAPDILGIRLTPARQALCLEALALLGDSDAQLREHVTAHLVAITTVWLGPRATGAPIDHADASLQFARLRAAHTAALGAATTGDRLAIAGELVELGTGAADDEILAWGHFWRSDALAQLGLRYELTTAIASLTEVTARLASPVWNWRLSCVAASIALLEDRVGDVPEALDAVAEWGERAGLEDARWLELTIRSEYAIRTHEGLVDVEAQIRRALVGAPALAHGWRARVLLAMGNTDEARAIWRNLAPHLQDFPLRSLEWVLAMVGFADLAILAGDEERARWILESLTPFGHLHAIGTVIGPYYGPVACALGRLATFFGDGAGGERWLADAAARADAMHAPWHAASA
ncbi:hypothetical protein, partial [Microbacterium sp.]|uniref:hypothetical protein n=1 Tax=Microbacterium sp. TaxID=51671 RepID=UPI003C749664